MGLLDQFANLDPDQTQGLLAAAAQMLQQSGPSRTPVGFGQVVGGGLQAYQGSMLDAKKRKQEQEQAAQMAQLRGLQIQEAQGGLADHDQARKEAERYRAYLMGGGQGAQAGQATPMPPSQPASAMLAPSLAGQSMQPPQTTQASAGPAFGSYEYMMAKAQDLMKNGFPAQAQAMMKEAVSSRPKFANEPRTVMGPNGKPMLVQMADDGTVRPIEGGYGLAEKLHFQDTGGGYAGLGEYSGDVKTQGKKTITAGEAASLAQSERHFREGQTTPQYMETSEGIMALPKKLSPGQLPTGQLVMGPNGAPLEKKSNTPQYAVQGIIGNAESLASVNAALAALDTPGGADAVGLKGYLPNAMLNRMYPEGTTTRADISDVGSLKLHDRSGAAVTAAESPRLMPFIPLATDDAKTAKAKLQRFKQALEAETNNLTFQFPQAKKLAEEAAKNGKRPGPANGGASGDWGREGNVINFGDLK